jgi:hypothetical protein
MIDLSRREYSIWNGILTAFGVSRNSKEIQCAQAAMLILSRVGLQLKAETLPEPGAIALEVERLTHNPVRLER